MSMGTFTLSCLMLCLGQTGQDLWYTPDRHFKIPINIPPAFRAEVKQIVLYTSKDKGGVWEQDSVIGAEQDGFVLHVPADGEYWYRVAVVNKLGKQDPPDIAHAAETHKVIVDTLRPTVRIISAQRQGDEVIVRWEIQETNPDMKSFRLRYRPVGATVAPWSEPAPVAPALVGETRVKVGTNALTFRLDMKDMAGNFSFDEASVAGDLALATFQANGQGTNVPPTIASATNTPPSPPQQNNLPQPPPLPPSPPAPTLPDKVQPAPTSSFKPEQQVAWDSTGSGPKPFTSEATKVQPPVASTTDGGFTHEAAAAPAAPPTPRPLPALQIVNKPEVVVQYELNHVGPAGVSLIELWLTKDDGQTWEPYKKDDTAVRGGKYTRTLDLPGEGVYGFSLVVYNKAKRGRRPVAGDAPQMRIELDQTAPEASLWPPEPDPHQRDAVVITWETRDKNLSTQAVTLEWAEQRNGPWNAIHAGLPNTGKYSWQVPQGAPPYAYLRLRVRDKAGNEGVIITNQPQPIDVSEPEGRLIGVTLSAAEGH